MERNYIKCIKTQNSDPYENAVAERINGILKQEFEAKKQTDKVFAENGGDQLYWVYKHSKYFEKAYLQYPVFRIN